MAKDESRWEKAGRSRTAPTGLSVEEFQSEAETVGEGFGEKLENRPNTIVLMAGLCNNSEAVGVQLPEDVHRWLTTFCEAAPRLGTTRLKGDRRPHPWAFANLSKPLNSIALTLAGQLGGQKGLEIFTKLMQAAYVRASQSFEIADARGVANAVTSHAAGVVNYSAGMAIRTPITQLGHVMAGQAAGQGQQNPPGSFGAYANAAATGAGIGAMGGPWGAAGGAAVGAGYEFGRAQGWWGGGNQGPPPQEQAKEGTNPPPPPAPGPAK